MLKNFTKILFFCLLGVIVFPPSVQALSCSAKLSSLKCYSGQYKRQTYYGTKTTGYYCCSDCPAGYMCDGTNITICPNGRYQPKTKMSYCSVCPAGQVSNILGATSCTKCDADKVPNKEGTLCICPEHATCANNTYTCERGYAKKHGGVECVSCGIGCASCPYGAIGASNGYPIYGYRCNSCKEEEGWDSRQGPQGSFYCECRVGKYRDGDKCVDCQANCYICNNGTTCTRCNNGYTLKNGKCVHSYNLVKVDQSSERIITYDLDTEKSYEDEAKGYEKSFGAANVECNAQVQKGGAEIICQPKNDSDMLFWTGNCTKFKTEKEIEQGSKQVSACRVINNSLRQLYCLDPYTYDRSDNLCKATWTVTYKDNSGYAVSNTIELNVQPQDTEGNSCPGTVKDVNGKNKTFSCVKTGPSDFWNKESCENFMKAKGISSSAAECVAKWGGVEMKINDGYYRDGNSVKSCKAECSACSSGNSCDSCKSGYVYNGRTRSCLAAPSNCLEAELAPCPYAHTKNAEGCRTYIATSVVCKTCEDGYYGDYCMRVPENATRSQDGKSFDCNTGYFPVHYYGGEFCFPLPENCAEAKADMSREGNAVCTACNPPYHWDDAKSKCVCPKAGWAKCAVSTCSNKGCANGFRPVAYPTECAEGYDLQDNKCLRRFSVIKGGGASAGGEEEKIVLEEDEEIDLKAIMEEKRDEENGKGKGLYQCRITGVDSGWDDGAPYAAIECPCVDKRFSNDMYCGMHAQFIEKVYDPELYICRKTHEGACGFLFMKDTVKMCMPGLHKSKDGTRCSKSEQQ